MTLSNVFVHDNHIIEDHLLHEVDNRNGIFLSDILLVLNRLDYIVYGFLFPECAWNQLLQIVVNFMQQNDSLKSGLSVRLYEICYQFELVAVVDQLPDSHLELDDPVEYNREESGFLSHCSRKRIIQPQFVAQILVHRKLLYLV